MNFLIIAPYKYSYLLTHSLTSCSACSTIQNEYMVMKTRPSRALSKQTASELKKTSSLTTAMLLLARLKGHVCDGCRCRSVVRCPTSVVSLVHGRASKTNQDRPIVRHTCNTIRKSATLILLPHSDPTPDSPGVIFEFKIQNICKY